MSDDRKEEEPSAPSVEHKQEPEGEPGNTVPFGPYDTAIPARIHTVEAAMTTPSSVTLQLEAAAYPGKLLSVARSLIDQGQPSIAVVVAHMACEVATERKLSEAFSAKGLQYLEESVTDLLNGYNLSNEKNRKLYVSLTGDEVHKAGFWSKFKESATRRNKIIHEGLNVDTAAAEDSYQAADNLLVHFRSNRF
jgi:hypothetical protein